MPPSDSAADLKDPSYPRVLVIGSFLPTDNSASGHLLRNLFSSWPTHSLAYAHLGLHSELTASDLNVLLLDTPVAKASRLLGRRVSSGSPSILAPSSGASSSPLKNFGLSFLETLPIGLDAKRTDWLKAYSPQVIYTWLGTPGIHRLVARIGTITGAPTVIHIMDDWISCKYAGSPLTWAARQALTRSFSNAVSSATDCIAIAKPMATEYNNRYNRKFNIVGNAVNLNHFKGCRSPRSDIPRGEGLRIAHVGRLNAGRADRLVEVLHALDTLALRSLDSSLLIVGAARKDAPSPILTSPRVKFYEQASDDILSNLAEQIDVLLQIESFNSAENDWFRLSLSGKLPLYLAMGRPILAYGSRSLASISMIEDESCGIVVDQPNPKLLEEAIQHMYTRPDSRHDWGARARKLAERDFNLVTTRETLRRILSKSAFPSK